MKNYEFWLESDYGAMFGLIEASSEAHFIEILRQDHRDDIGADGAFDCPKTGDEKFIDGGLKA